MHHVSETPRKDEVHRFSLCMYMSRSSISM